MNSFSINRFWLMLRWLINVNRVRLLGFTVGIMFSTFLIQLIMFVFGSFEKIFPYLLSCVHFGSFLIPFVIPITVCLAFTSFTSIGNQQQRGTCPGRLPPYGRLMDRGAVVCRSCYESF